MLGFLLAEDNRNQEALAAWQRAMKLAPFDAQPRVMAARLLHKMGRDSEALDLFRAALHILPGDPGAQALIAEIEHPAAAH
jgi:tetratricopeptide (TPR) repeat protein